MTALSNGAAAVLWLGNKCADDALRIKCTQARLLAIWRESKRCAAHDQLCKSAGARAYFSCGFGDDVALRRSRTSAVRLAPDGANTNAVSSFNTN